MNKTNPKIPTLSPVIFKNIHIRNSSDEVLNDENISQFFIHSFKDADIDLNLPLPPHKKTVNDFVFISKGFMTRNLGIESFQLKKNDFLFTPKNSITMTELASADLEGYYCHFSDEFIEANPFIGILHTQATIQNYSQVSKHDAHSLEVLLERILQLYKTRKIEPNNYRLIPFYLSTVIAELFLIIKKNPVIHQLNNAVSSAFKSFVHQHFKQNLNVNEYSSMLNITPNHLNKMVKKDTGRTASEVIKGITILEAKVLLLQTRLTICEISAELGFTDSSYFSRFFKNETSHSPSSYRKMIDLY